MSSRQSKYCTASEDARERAKEAVVPDQLCRAEIGRSMFFDNNELRRPEDLIRVFDYHSTHKAFSDKEQLLFAEAFKHTPKDFAAIASLLPGRTPKECNDHYYANKFDKRFKTESMRQREAEEGLTRNDLTDEEAIDFRDARRKKSAVKEDKDMDVVPIDREIARLRAITGEKGRQYRKGYPRNAKEPIVLPRLDLSILRQAFTAPFEMTDVQLLQWLRSASVLLLVKQWKLLCIDDSKLYIQMQSLLEERERPWSKRAEQITHHADQYGEGTFELRIRSGVALMCCANYAAKMSKSNPALFEGFGPYAFPKSERLRACVLVLFTVYDNLRQVDGFFGVLLKSELADPISLTVRQAWELKYQFEGEDDVEAGEHAASAGSFKTSSSGLLGLTMANQTSSAQPQRRSRMIDDHDASSTEPDMDEGLAINDEEIDGDIPDDKQEANSKLRAEALGLRDAVNCLHGKLQESDAKLQESKITIADLERRLKKANSCISQQQRKME